MWRVIMFLKRLSSVTQAQMQSGWLEQRTSLLLDRLRESVSFTRATFNPATEDGYDGSPTEYDGVLDLRFGEFLPAAAALSLLQSNSTIRADAARWLQLDASPAWIGKARPVLDKPGANARLFVAAQVAHDRRDHEEDAQRYWGDVHPVVAQRDLEFWGRLLRYTQIHGFRTPGTANHMPIAAEIGAASFEVLKAAFATEYYRTTVRPDEMKFVSPDGMLALASSQEIVLYERTA
jgi:hypothetical protein